MVTIKGYKYLRPCDSCKEADSTMNVIFGKKLYIHLCNQCYRELELTVKARSEIYKESRSK